MSFRDFITSRWFRRELEAGLDRLENITPPSNPSRRYIDKLVQRLLKERTASDAKAELSVIGLAAVPSLVIALKDARFRETHRKDFRVPAPLDTVLELLVPHAAEHVRAAAMPLVESPSNEVRKTIALHLASLGSTDILPFLAKLLQDSDGYVRSYVAIGVDRALVAGRPTEEFRQGMYTLLLAQCDQEWTGTTNDAPKLVVALDSARAAVDFGSDRWLTLENRNTHRIIEACNRARICLPEKVVFPLFEHSLPLAKGDRCYPHQYVAAAALESLALRLGEQAKSLLENSLRNVQAEIQEAAARGLVALAGLDDPVAFVLNRERESGFDLLTRPQRIVYCAFIFDVEVCNGGIMQFFGNTTGNNASDTLDALRELRHPESIDALAGAIAHIGPLALEPDRKLRQSAFEDRYDELQTLFSQLEGAYYRTTGQLRQKMLLYAANHAEHFRN